MMRSKIAVMTVALIVSVLLVGCGAEGKGTLQVKTTVWNSYGSKSLKRSLKEARADTNTCDIIDARTIIYEIKVTTGNVIEGEPDTLDWVTIYNSSEEMLHTEREITLEIPAGSYKGFRIVQRNKHYWICTCGSDTLEFPAFNDSNLDPADSLLNIFGENGLYELDADGNFTLEYPDEKLGTFEIQDGEVTKVTMRLNFETLDWMDNDEDGEWSDGDELDNWTLPDGIMTMCDFIVEYE